MLDTDCRAHELDNLYVVDTSFFPSIGAVNPALTAMANALRVGDHVLERMGAQPSRREPAQRGLSTPDRARGRLRLHHGRSRSLAVRDDVDLPFSVRPTDAGPGSAGRDHADDLASNS